MFLTAKTIHRSARTSPTFSAEYAVTAAGIDEVGFGRRRTELNFYQQLDFGKV